GTGRLFVRCGNLVVAARALELRRAMPQRQSRLGRSFALPALWLRSRRRQGVDEQRTRVGVAVIRSSAGSTLALSAGGCIDGLVAQAGPFTPLSRHRRVADQVRPIRLAVQRKPRDGD